MDPIKVIILYLAGVNILTFIAFFSDKKRAKEGTWRISERTLILLSLFGGTLGALWGMKIFRHKTKHLKFTIGLPVLLVLQIGLAFFWFYINFIG